MRSLSASGSVSSDSAASTNIALTQPASAINRSVTGAKTNWPNEPPALTKPAPKDRFSGGSRWAAALIRMEKLPAPAPAATRMPIEKIRPQSLVM